MNNTIALAQVDPIVGNIEYNFSKAHEYIEKANKLNVDAVIFPELFLIGNPYCDLPDKFPSIVEKNIEYLNKLAKITGKTKVIIGFLEIKDNKHYDSIAVLQNGKIEKVVRKNGCNFKERFVQIRDKKAFILIGDEDLEIKNKDFDFIINPASYISRKGSEQKLNSRILSINKKFKTPIVFVNQTGAVDNFVFAGTSRCYDKTGKIVARAKAYKEDFFLINLSDNSKNKVYDLPRGMEKGEEKTFSLEYKNDLERTYLAIITSIKGYFNKNGLKRAVLGVSGGLDSTICAVLLADALGSENVCAVSMPSKITSKESKNDAEKLCENLGINYFEAPIKDMVETSSITFNKVFDRVEEKWKDRYKKSFTMDNIQARSRATILFGITNEFPQAITIATSDKSESYMGYATINGDMSGGFAPIADVTKTKLFALAKWLNKNRPQKNVIPKSIIEKRPGAELAINPKTGKPLLAEEALMPYEFLDEVIFRIENYHQTKDFMMKEKFLYEKTNKITKKQKQEWLDKFFNRMQTASFKWILMPPAPIIDSHSINKAEYNQPVTSKVNF